MNRKLTAVMVVVCMLLPLYGCVAHHHMVGTGPSGSGSESTRQWYILFGLVPLNKVDTNAMAGGAANYEIYTRTNVLDAIISAFTGIITVSERSVTVKK